MINNLFQSSQKCLGTALLISLLTTGCSTTEKKAARPQAIPVTLQTLQSVSLVDSSRYVGTLEARQRVNLAPSRTSGRIANILVKEGDVVRQGQTLVEIQPIQEQEDVRAATGSVNVAKANLSAAEAEYRQREAERDKAKFDIEQTKAQIAGAEASIENLRAQLKLAEINHKRAVFLVKEGVQAQQNLDDRISELDSTKARLQETIKARDASLEALNAAIQSLRASQRRVEQALANINSRKSSITEAQGQLGSTSQGLAYNFLYAPINGVVGDFKERKLGDNIDIGQVITTITDNQVFNLNVNIPTENRNQLRKGLPVEIINSDGSQGVRGQITYIAPLVEQNAQVIPVKMTFRNNGTLRDRQYVQVRVIWNQKPGVLVPTTAVSSLGGQKFVFVAQPADSKEGKGTLVAKQIPVEVGAIQGQAYQVISGVKPGDRIAVSRILDLRDGRLITSASLTSQNTVKQ